VEKEKSPRPIPRSVVRVAAAAYCAAGAAGLALTLLLLVTAETWQGRIFALAVVLLLLLPGSFLLSLYAEEKRRWRFVTRILAAAGGVGLGVCAALTPSGEAPEESRVESCFAGDARYVRWSIANMVPEVDQLKMGSYLIPLADPFIDGPKAKRIRQLFLDVYREMRQSPDFVELGSMMNYAYRDIYFGSRPKGHYYQYRGVRETPDFIPAITFLHGSMGNFKGYTWVWKRFADKHGFVVLAPTFGAGSWDDKDGVEAVELVQTFSSGDCWIDHTRNYLAGLSNGGKGVVRVAAKHPWSYLGLILISPVMEPELFASEEFVKGWKGRPVLVIHGLKDERIDPVYVKQAVNLMKKAGVDVTARYYPDEDHFLFFSAWERVSEDVARWMKLEPAARAGKHGID
jgi:pimeloyl-ACP methyl ester carboxylesterase